MCITGSDATAIARRLGVEPWSFTVALPAPSDADDGFRLSPGGGLFRLALARTRFEGDPAEGCTFLLRLHDGSLRCGLGEGRPRICRSFPRLDGNDPGDPIAAGCSCAWSGVDLGDGQGNAELAALEVDRSRYAGVVARWNAYVAELSPGTLLSVRDFGRYLLDAFAA